MLKIYTEVCSTARENSKRQNRQTLSPEKTLILDNYLLQCTGQTQAQDTHMGGKVRLGRFIVGLVEIRWSGEVRWRGERAEERGEGRWRGQAGVSQGLASRQAGRQARDDPEAQGKDS